MSEKFPPPRAILFDFDGTLVNTTPLILHSFREAWRQTFGFTYEDGDYIRTFGMLLPTALRMLVERGVAEGRIEAPADPAAFVARRSEEMLQNYRAINLRCHDEMIEPFDGVIEALEALRAREIPLGIVSSKMRAGVERGLRHFAMGGYFNLIVAAEDVTNHKPHPEPLLRAAERLGLAPREIVYLGDSIHDIAAGQAAGTATAAAAWGPFPHAELERLGPDHLLHHPRELPPLFTGAPG
ncbi:MAG: HAD family hydrolase [Blastocatellia bacterium]|nr:HAD family hydrolase [Blastocatellia bacterium]